MGVFFVIYSNKIKSIPNIKKAVFIIYFPDKIGIRKSVG